MTWALAAALCLTATPPRYGGELRVLLPASALDPDRLEPGAARTPLELTLARTLCEPLLALDAQGLPVAAAALLPEADPRGRQLALSLLPGPVRGRDVAALLGSLEAPGNPYRALTLPLAGHATFTDAAVAVPLRFPYPDLARGLAHVGSCPVPAGHRSTAPGAQSGPFTIGQRLAAPAARLSQNPVDAVGRPFVDRLALRTVSPKAAARSLAAGDAELALLGSGEGRVEGPLAVATYLVVNPGRAALQPLAPLVSREIDRAELVRTFVPGPAAPLWGLLAPSVDPQALPPATPPLDGTATPSLAAELLVDGAGEGRGVAERLQVKLHDLGVRLRVVALPRRELEQRLGAGDFDAALVAVPALPEAGLNLAQVLLLAWPAERVQQELAAIGALADPAARRARAQQRARELQPRVPVVPLYAQGLQAVTRPGVRGLRFEAAGTIDLGAVWLETPDARGPLPGTE